MSATQDQTRPDANADLASEQMHVFVRDADGQTFVIAPNVLEAFSLEGTVLVRVGDKSYAVPEAVVALQPLPVDASSTIREALDNQAESGENQRLNITMPWNYIAYATCFYASWAGGGSAIAAGDHCAAVYL